MVRAAFARLWHTGRDYVEITHRRKRQFQNSSGFRVIEKANDLKKLDVFLGLLLRDVGA